MGNKLNIESQPILRGDTPNIISFEEKSYFDRIKLLQKDYYITNMYSDNNLNISLEIKSFKTNPIRPNNIQDISWLDYIINYIERIEDTKHYSWCHELLYFIRNQKFISENKYDSIFFFNEYLIKTIPETLNTNPDLDNDANVLDVDKLDATYVSGPIIMDELDITANLGGSYLELNTDDLLPDDPTVQYQKRRKLIKKYIQIFKEHIYKNNDHPIMAIISAFIRIFCKYINNNTKSFDDQIKKNVIDGENYNKRLKDFEEEITSSLQDFISQIHCTLKLFYSTVVDYTAFQEEKDDLINMLITLFFKTGNLYETIYNLYSMSFAKEISDLQDKLIALKNVKPKSLGVEVKFCLDDDTLQLQQEILKKKREEKDEKEIENENNQENDNNKEKNKDILDSKISGLDLIKEGDDEEKDDDNNIISTDTKIKNQRNDESSIYLLEKINAEMLDDNDNVNDVPMFAGFAQIRNTINLFNSKKFLYPKLHNKLRDTISMKDQYIKEAKAIGKLPVPYLSAIKLLNSLKKYKAPFEKIVIIAAISDQITECATSFWSEMGKYIKNSFLFIEADEIMTIFLYIMIRSQMPEIIVFSKMITNFTTPNTRSFNISYNFTLLEASLEYISTLRNIKELLKGDDIQLKDARKSLAGITNQRLSLLA